MNVPFDVGRIKTRSVLTCAVLVGLALQPVTARASSLRVVGADPAGDWFGGVGAQVGQTASQDLIEASIGRRGRKLDFQIRLAAMPSADQARVNFYNWAFQLSTDKDSVWHQISPALSGDGVLFTMSTCRRVNQTIGPFQQSSVCEVVDEIEASFDPVAGTITWTVPVTTLTTATSFEVEPKATVYASAWVSVTANNSGPHDYLVTNKAFRYRS